MKFKVLFVIFNIVLFTLLFTIFFFPLFFESLSFTNDFWKLNWFLGPLLLLSLIVIDFIFLRNFKLLEAIDAKDWTALSMHLEDAVLNKKNFHFYKVKLLADSLVLLGDVSGMNRLELALKKNKPKHLNRLAPTFAVSKMISGNYEELADFSLHFKTSENEDWMAFYYALALHLTQDAYKSAEQFKILYHKTKNTLLKVLTAYFIIDTLKGYSKMSEDELVNEKNVLMETIEKEYNAKTWEKYIESQKQEIHIIILKKIITEASEWIWKN